MTAVVVTLAEAVKDALNAAAAAGTLTPYFVAVRSNKPPVYGLADLAELKVTVVPGAHVAEAFDLSGRKADDWDIAIWIQQRTGPENEATDPLLQLAQDIEDVFDPAWRRDQRKRLIRLENRPATDPAIHDTRGEFRSIVTLTLRVTR